MVLAYSLYTCSYTHARKYNGGSETPLTLPLLPGISVLAIQPPSNTQPLSRGSAFASKSIEGYGATCNVILESCKNVRLAMIFICQHFTREYAWTFLDLSWPSDIAFTPSKHVPHDVSPTKAVPPLKLFAIFYFTLSTFSPISQHTSLHLCTSTCQHG
jgi:hypothetical protein